MLAVVFGVTLSLQHSTWSPALPYVDPVLVLLVVVATIKAPIDVIKRGLFQLLLASPEPELKALCLEKINPILSQLNFSRVNFETFRQERELEGRPLPHNVNDSGLRPALRCLTWTLNMEESYEEPVVCYD